MYVLFLLMALIPQTLGHTSFNQALRYFPTRTVSLALLFEPVGSSILAIFLLNEIPSVTEIAGGIFILLGLVFALRGKPNEAWRLLPREHPTIEYIFVFPQLINGYTVSLVFGARTPRLMRAHPGTSATSSCQRWIQVSWSGILRPSPGDLAREP